MSKDKRFEKAYTEGNDLSFRSTVLVDKKTGVNYLFVTSGYAGGLTPLLDRDGKPLVSGTAYTPEY